jgi:predicted component of type VI protein secretion system
VIPAARSSGASGNGAGGTGDTGGDTRIFRPRPAGPRLRVLAGPGVEAGREYALRGPAVTIGRRDDQDIVLEDQSVSRVHARIEIAPGGATITDAGSTNGTRVNGVPLRSGAAPLRAGDRIEIGRIVLQFVEAA